MENSVSWFDDYVCLSGYVIGKDLMYFLKNFVGLLLFVCVFSNSGICITLDISV